MTPWSVGALAGWLALSLLSLAVWTAPGRPRSRLTRTNALVTVVAVEVAGTAAVAFLAAGGRPLDPPWSWCAVGVAAVATVLCGGAVTWSVLALADASARGGGPRVQRTILRGGTWIGALERLAMTATLVAEPRATM